MNVMGEAKVEKRNRPPKSCEPCRIRKLKCNRAFPCDTCIKRGKNLLCQYAPNADRNERRENKTRSVSERLKSVEELVSSLAHHEATASLNTARQPAPVLHSPVSSTKTIDHGLLGGNKATYLDSSHWSSLLEDIREIREQISPSNGDEQSPATNSFSADVEWTAKEGVGEDADLVFGRTETTTFEQIISSLPSRQVCDSLVSQYFRPADAILPILHPTKFQREYEAFWTAPTETPIVWIALLFSILNLTASLYEISSKNISSESNIPPAKFFRKRMEQCLILGNYAKAEEHSLETLLVHLQGCFMRSRDSDVNLWLLMGVIIRLAIRLGYHRDPDRLPRSRLSPFDGEMRRRIWVSIYQVDTLMSFQMGFPSMIPTEYCDAQLPRNLENYDFSPETTVLPPSRPLSDNTPLLYTIAKNGIIELFRAVVGHTRSLKPSGYEKTMVLDAELRNTYDKLPFSLKYKPLSQSIIDSPGIIMKRVTIEMLYLKSLIALHREYITTNRQNSIYNISRRACLEAARAVLDRQAELHHATQPGSQLFEDRWMVSALTANDFILAAMMICLELAIRTKESTVLGPLKGQMGDEDDANFMLYLDAIVVSHQIWTAASAFSFEARIAAHALGSTIERVQAHRAMLTHSRASQDLQAGTFDLSMTPQVGNQDPVNQTLGFTDGMEYIDWGVLDNQFQVPVSGELDLDSWILEAVGPWGPSQPF